MQRGGRSRTVANRPIAAVQKAAAYLFDDISDTDGLGLTVVGLSLAGQQRHSPR